MRITIEIGPQSPTSNDKRLKQLVQLVLQDTYLYPTIQNRQHFPGLWRPWSRRYVGQYTLSDETAPVGEDLAARVTSYLEAAGIIDPETNQINLEKYPDLKSAQRAISSPGWLDNLKSILPVRLATE